MKTMVKFLASAAVLLALCVSAAAVDVNAVDENGRTALISAVRDNDFEKVEEFLASGANPNAADNDGSTPLHSAANYGQTEMAKLLLEGGANVNAADTWGITPLHEAVESGADPKIADKQGKTALSLAEKNGKAKIVEYLKSKM